MSELVGNILQHKASGVVSVPSGEPLLGLSVLLVARNIGAVPVLDQAGKLIGLVSERDIVVGLSKHRERITSLTAADVMARDIQTCGLETTIVDAMQIMTDYRQRHIPVLEDGKLIGIFSIGDLVKHRLEEASMIVDAMRSYIMQTDPHPDTGVRRPAA